MEKEIKIKPWRKIVCFFLGHKDMDELEKKSNPHGSVMIITSDTIYGHSKITAKSCMRCGFYFENVLYLKKQLTEKEKMIKDIIA